MNNGLRKLRVSDLGRVVTGKTPPTAKHHLYGDVYPFITPTDIGEERHCHTARAISEDGRNSQKNLLLPARSICVTCIASIGKTCMTKEPSFTNQQINSVIVDEERFDPFFVYHLLKSIGSHLKAIASGAATPILNKTSFSEVEVEVPDLPTQRKIAGILSAYDDLIENNLRRIRILEEMAQSLYREWFVHFRFPGHESVPLTDSPLGPIPQGWEVKKMGDIAEDKRRGVPKGNLDEPTPYVGLEHIPRRSLALDDWEIVSELGSNKMRFESGEILFGKIRPYFHKVSVAPFSGVCSADAIVIRAKSSEDTSLVTACVSSVPFVAHASATANGAKMPRADWKVLVKYPLVVPPAELKEKFSSFFSTAVDEQMNLIRRNQALRATRDLLLPKLLTGVEQS